jgi:predicted hydrocarbon binding protein
LSNTGQNGDYDGTRKALFTALVTNYAKSLGRMLQELGMTFGRNLLPAQVIDSIQTWNAFMRFSTIQILAPVSLLIEG